MDRQLHAPLIFVHMFKAGGTSLRRIIRSQFPAKAKVWQSIGKPEELAAWLALSQDERDQHDLLMAHEHYGLHQSLTRNATYLTMLRDPVDRILSFFYFVKRTKTHYLYRHGFTDDTTLEEFITRRNLELDNVQTRLLVPHSEGSIDFGAVDERLSRIALANLNKIERVGILERMDDFLDLLNVVEGWNVSAAPVMNRTEKRPGVEEHSEAVIARIREMNAYDVRLYEAARERFERDWAECQSTLKKVDA